MYNEEDSKEVKKTTEKFDSDNRLSINFFLINNVDCLFQIFIYLFISFKPDFLF